MGVIIAKALKALLLPPGIQVLAFLSGFILLNRRQFLAVLLLLFAFVSLYAVSIPWTANKLISSLETYPQLNIKHSAKFADAGAIVVLGSGSYYDNMERVSNNIGMKALMKLRFVARLARKANLPILLSGGKIYNKGHSSEAAIMQQILVKDFGIKADYWLEEQSQNLKEHAKFARALLGKKEIKKIILVTQAWHMLRAAAIFKRAGLKVISAPTGFYTMSQEMPLVAKWLPSAKAFFISSMACHEYLDRFWYFLFP